LGFKDIHINNRKKTAETDVGTIASNFKKIRKVYQERTGTCIMDGLTVVREANFH
jgi:hypothetical protein